MFQRMKDGGGISFDIDVEKGDEETSATTLVGQSDNDEHNGDRDKDKSKDKGEWV
jgi:hypothetical protein